MVLLSVEFLILLISIILIIIGKVKNKRGILTTGICIILLQILVTILLFTYLIEREQEININSTESVIEQEELPIPDRIVVKDEEGKYEIIQSWSGSEFSDMYSLLYSEMVNTIEGKVYQEDEISRRRPASSGGRRGPSSAAPWPVRCPRPGRRISLSLRYTYAASCSRIFPRAVASGEPVSTLRPMARSVRWLR